ncbi:flagellar assembly protein FliW [Rickettsiales bacterium]|nr:flagellar assembly protein FliW [Rickettsiales bacterium]
MHNISTTEEKQTLKRTRERVSKKKNTTREISSRFGILQVDTKSVINFEHGLLGIPDAVSFYLTDFPNKDTDQFKILQCSQDESLSFIVVPSQYDNQLIEPEDLDEACKILGINKDFMLILFIVTVHVNGTQRRLSVNAKAPVLIDTQTKTATQYVLQSPIYNIKHMIS